MGGRPPMYATLLIFDSKSDEKSLEKAYVLCLMASNTIFRIGFTFIVHAWLAIV